MSQQTHSLKRPTWVTKGTIVLHVCPQTRQPTLFVLHKLQQQRGTATLYLLSRDDSDKRFPLEECKAAFWADFSTLRNLQVGQEVWSITHPHHQLAAHEDSEASWLTLSEVYLTALALANEFGGTVLLPPQESLAGETEQLSVQWTETET